MILDRVSSGWYNPDMMDREKRIQVKRVRQFPGIRQAGGSRS